MMKHYLTLLPALLLAVSCGLRDGSYTFNICTTNDVHGRYFDSLYVGDGTAGSLLAISATVDSIRHAAGSENVISGSQFFSSRRELSKPRRELLNPRRELSNPRRELSNPRRELKN